jgi:hypothetical protein
VYRGTSRRERFVLSLGTDEPRKLMPLIRSLLLSPSTSHGLREVQATLDLIDVDRPSRVEHVRIASVVGHQLAGAHQTVVLLA